MALRALQAYLVESGVPPEVQPDFDGLFRTDCAYVVLAADEDSKNRLFLWTGEGSSKKTRQRAAKHAAELVTTLDAGDVAREQQGEESIEFKQMWAELRYKSGAGASESTQEQEAAPAPAEAPQSEESQAAAEAQQEASQPPAAEEEAQPKVAAEEAAAAAEAYASPIKDESSPAAAASPDKPASPAPAASPAKASPSPAASLASAAASPPKAAAAENGTAAVESAPPKAAAAAPGAAPAPDAKVKSPKAGETEAVAKARQLLTKHLSGTFADPLHQKKSSAGNSPTAGAATTYLADSAKVWGGPVGVPPPVSDVKFQPLKDTFPYEELKAMRSDSGIDMTRKEDYLSEEEFVKVFGKDRAVFKAQPAWRQQMAKKAVHLF